MKLTYVWMACMLALLSCNDHKTASTSDQIDKMEAALNEVVEKEAAQFTDKLDELLTPAIAAAITGYNEAEAEKDYNKVLKNPATHSLGYRWEKGRIKKMNIGKNGMDLPQEDFIEISWVKNTSLESFKASYRNPTEAELKKANEAMNNKMAEMEESGKVSKQNANMGMSMAGEMMKGVSFEPVDNVGEYAVWNKKYKDLKVFYKGLEFQINVDVSDDENNNKAKAIATAQKIIAEKL